MLEVATQRDGAHGSVPNVQSAGMDPERHVLRIGNLEEFLKGLPELSSFFAPNVLGVYLPRDLFEFILAAISPLSQERPSASIELLLESGLIALGDDGKYHSTARFGEGLIIIGADAGEDAIRHELRHERFATDRTFEEECKSAFEKMTDVAKARAFIALTVWGYAGWVSLRPTDAGAYRRLVNEHQAYAADDTTWDLVRPETVGLEKSALFEEKVEYLRSQFAAIYGPPQVQATLGNRSAILQVGQILFALHDADGRLEVFGLEYGQLRDYRLLFDESGNGVFRYIDKSTPATDQTYISSDGLREVEFLRTPDGRTIAVIVDYSTGDTLARVEVTSLRRDARGNVTSFEGIILKGYGAEDATPESRVVVDNNRLHEAFPSMLPSTVLGIGSIVLPPRPVRIAK